MIIKRLPNSPKLLITCTKTDGGEGSMVQVARHEARSKRAVVEASPKQLLEVANGVEQSNNKLHVGGDVGGETETYAINRRRVRRESKGEGESGGIMGGSGEILNHEIVCGFLSHCGWNSVLESICTGVAILAMPLMADQHLNARMVVEEIGMGLRLWPNNIAPRGVVEAKAMAKMVVELMEGEGGRRVMKRVKEVRESAYGAMKEGGSSSRTLDLLIDHVCGEDANKVFE